MSGTVSIEGKISFQIGEAQADRNPEINFAIDDLVYGPMSAYHLEFPALVTDENVLLGTITDAKVVFVRSTHHGGVLKINGGTGVLIDPQPTGGWLIFANPSGGITSLTLTTTDAAKFELMLFQ